MNVIVGVTLHYIVGDQRILTSALKQSLCKHVRITGSVVLQQPSIRGFAFGQSDLCAFRPDLGFTWISEQVSHHPPVSAFHATGTNPDHPFIFHGSIHPKLKFWGKTVEVEPRGALTLTFPA